MNQKPQATIFAGTNGTGKTTLYYQELENGKEFGYRINIDEFVSSFGDWRETKDQIRASKIAIRLREQYIKERKDFNIETTLCGNSILSLFKELKEKGYFIALYYIGLDNPEIAKERVKIRVKKGGHNVEESKIEERYYKSLKNLEVILPFCDKLIIFDNSKELTKIFEGFKDENSKIAITLKSPKQWLDKTINNLTKEGDTYPKGARETLEALAKYYTK